MQRYSRLEWPACCGVTAGARHAAWPSSPRRQRARRDPVGHRAARCGRAPVPARCVRRAPRACHARNPSDRETSEIVNASAPAGVTSTSTFRPPIRSSSTVTGWTYWPSAATTVSGSPGIRTSKIDIDEPLMNRSRKRSPGWNSPVQFAPGPRRSKIAYPAPSRRPARSAPCASAPIAALRERGREAVALSVARKVAERSLPKVEIVGAALEQQVHRARVTIGPIRQQDHVLAVVGERRGLPRLDDERAVQPLCS